MIPFCTDTATLYHYTKKDTWQRVELRGVLWRAGNFADRQQGGDRPVRRSAVRITIPGGILPGLQIDADGKDYFILGAGRDITEEYSPEDLKKDHPELGTVTRIKDNTRTFMPHWVVELK